MTRVGHEIFILAAAVAYGLFTFPRNYMTATSVLAVVAFVMSKSIPTVLAIFIGAAILRLFITSSMHSRPPVGSEVQRSIYTDQQREGFQPKDPVTIHQRIVKNKGPGPLNPHVETITGVLESPNILDALQISEVHPVEHCNP